MMHNSTERKGILSAGGLLTDHVFMIDAFPTIEGTLTIMDRVDRSVGGAPLNVLLTLAKMGADIPLSAAGIIGNDDDGLYILEMLRSHNVDASYITKSSLNTAYTHVLNARNNGQRTFFHELGANVQLDLSFFEPVQTQHKIFHLGYLLVLKALDQYDADYGCISARLFHYMQKKGYVTSLDLISSSDAEAFQNFVVPCLPYVNYLVINELEAAALSGITIKNEQGELIPTQIEESLRCIAAMGVNHYVVMHAPEGAWGISIADNSIIYVPSYYIEPTKIQGTVGAGDAFCAGFLYGIHELYSLEQSLKIAHACAHFNLYSKNSIDGTRPLTEVMALAS